MTLTVFEKLVLSLLIRIPKGKVITYAALARAVGRPKAVRATANAVGKNPDAPRVPCHRVVRSDGFVGGYSGPGGIATKVKLLEAEGVEVLKGRINTNLIIDKL